MLDWGYMDDQTPTFDTTILRKAGLTESQAKGYLALIEHGQLTPVELAEKTGEKMEKVGEKVKDAAKEVTK